MSKGFPAYRDEPQDPLGVLPPRRVEVTGIPTPPESPLVLESVDLRSPRLDDQQPPAQTLPSRRELLTVVRKHSRSLLSPGEHSSSPIANDDPEVDSRLWRELVDMFFVKGVVEASASAGHQDDMLFFVRPQRQSMWHTPVISHDSDDSDAEDGSEMPYFVRRWSPTVLAPFQTTTGDVDWRRTFYLNLIAHTTFSLTVAICSRAALQTHRKEGGTPVLPLFKVTKTVYASPSRARIDMDTSKATETVPAYPDICFAVDDYDDTFESVVISDPDHCFCVLLNAHGGASLPSVDDSEGTADVRRSAEARALGEAQDLKTNKVTLFSGFVGYEMVKAAFPGWRGRLGGLLPPSHGGKPERLVMRGPGGRGEADVAVSGVPVPAKDPSSEIPETGEAEEPAGAEVSEEGPLSPSEHGRLNLSLLMRRAAAGAQLAAKQVAKAYEAASKPDTTPHPLRCCLMSLTLPWDLLAHDLLFKELPKADVEPAKEEPENAP